MEPIIVQTGDIYSRDLLLIAAHILNKSYSQVFFAKNLKFSRAQYELFLEMSKKRQKGMPIAKIIGHKEFYGMDFITNEYTLDPRAETELIIDLVKKYYSDTNKAYNILDLGCGTGCVSITLLSIFKNSVAVLVDILPETLEVARQNAKNWGVFERCEFILSDWFEKVCGKYDIIVSNPPYVESGFKVDKQTSFDPAIALFAGEKGLDAYKQIIPHCSKYLRKNGLIFLEIGCNQAKLIENMLPIDLTIETIRKDLAKLDRVVVLKDNDWEHC